MFSLPPPPTRDRSAAALHHMVRDRLLAMPGAAPLKQEPALFGAIQTGTVTSSVPAGTVRNWCMQPIVPAADHAGFVNRPLSLAMI